MTVVAAMQNPQAGTPASRESVPETRWRRPLRIALIVAAVLAVLTSPWSAPRLLAQLDYFDLRRVEFEGVQYVRPADLRAAITVDSSWSVWNNLDTIARSVGAHPMIESVSIERRLPAGLLVRITERTPIALVLRRGVPTPVDAQGRDLPIEPALAPVDAPVVYTADSTVLRVLDELHRFAPEMYARVVSVRRIGTDHLLFDFELFDVRTRDDVTVARFRDILPVEADLARNRLRAVELDLRFQNQVIVRQP